MINQKNFFQLVYQVLISKVNDNKVFEWKFCFCLSWLLFLVAILASDQYRSLPLLLQFGSSFLESVEDNNNYYYNSFVLYPITIIVNNNKLPPSSC